MTSVSWDNIDRLEATLSGGGTSHRVNGIIVQPKVFGPHLPPKQPVVFVEKTKTRSVPANTQQLACYISGEKLGPGVLTVSENDEREHELQTNIARKKEGQEENKKRQTIAEDHSGFASGTVGSTTLRQCKLR